MKKLKKIERMSTNVNKTNTLNLLFPTLTRGFGGAIVLRPYPTGWASVHGLPSVNMKYSMYFMLTAYLVAECW